ncbi:hypothetical protein ACHAO7_008112 [Fusarium culmorum]|uniref:Uncharacterized protein n=1 Tax=Fusarium culmorum TaxID=5516 RepID=A0A2T4GGT4_FUSCU|nr:hypothetical protein FCULG_00009280 [Fusarium culmorum]
MPNVSVLFTKRDIRAITNGDIHWLVAVKLTRLSPRAFLYFSTFLWFDDFVASLPGPYSRTPQHLYERVMAFGRHKMQEIHIRTKREREELMQKSNAAAAVTPSGHVFCDDNLIVL